MSKIIDSEFSNFFTPLEIGTKVYITVREDIPHNYSGTIWWGCFLGQTLCCQIINVSNPNNPIVCLSDEDYEVLKRYKEGLYSQSVGINCNSITSYSTIAPPQHPTLQTLSKIILNELI